MKQKTLLNQFEGTLKRDIFNIAIAGLLMLSAYGTAATFPIIPPAGYDDNRSGIPHGTVSNVTYYSSVAGRNLVMKVYTPPNYNPNRKYGVIYCYQGIGAPIDFMFSNADWCVGVDVVCDNLVNEGIIQPVIIVALDDQFDGDYSNTNDMTIIDAIPYIDSHYSTYADADHRGLYGYSWGGGYAFNVGCANLNYFHHLSPTAAAPNKAGDTTLFPNGGAEAKQKLKTLFISWGQWDYDVIKTSNTNCHNYCTTNGIPHYWWEVAGAGHDKNVWRPAFWNFLQMADAAGISGIPVPISAFSQIEAEDYNTQSGTQTETCSEGGLDVGWIENGDYLVFKNVDFGGGAVSFDARVASAGSGGTIELYLDSVTGTQIGTCPAPITGGWQTWTTQSCPVSGAIGQHDLYVKFTGGASYLFNLNWVQFNNTAGQDIGTVGVAGSAVYGDGVFTVNGAGADIGGTVDAFRFVNVPTTGDCSITARVSSLENTDPWAKAGIMIRENLDADAANAFVALTADNGANWQYRSSAAGSTSESTAAGFDAPCWVKLVRSTDTFTGYASSDGVNWSQLGSTTIAMGPMVYVGLAVTSHDSSTLCTATFDNMVAPNWPTSAAPAGVSAISESGTQISLSWTPSMNVTSYNVKRSATSGGPYTVVADGLTTNHYNDTGLITDTVYYYVVSAMVCGSQTPNSAQAEAAPRNPRAHLKFNESSSTTAADATGNGWTGTLVNGPSWTAGKFGNAVNLDGSNDYVSLPAGVMNGLNDFTISTWVYLDVISTWSRVFDFGTGTTNYMFLTPRHSSTSGTVRFAIRTPSVSEQIINGTSALPTGAWTHVAVTLQGSTGTLYVNGSRVGTGSMTLTPTSLGATTQNYIGNSQYPDPYLDGRVDDFRIYQNALSAAEIKSLYEQQNYILPATPTGLTATAISHSRIDLAWTAAADATSYNIKRSTTNGGPYGTVGVSTGTSYSDTGVSGLTTYYYVVSAANIAGESANSTQAHATTPPAVPTGLTATAGNGSVVLNWNAITHSNLAGYNIYRSTTQASGYTLLNSSLVVNPEFTDDAVTNYVQYYYFVTAVDTSANESDSSDVVSAMPIDSRVVSLTGADFESGFGDWVNIAGADSHDWTRDSLGTLTPATGPSAGANGSTWYVYIETSPGGASVAGNTAILESPVIDGFKRVLMFYYHMYGANIGTLNVDVYDGSWHTGVWSLTGQQHSSNNEAYTQAIVDLSGYTGPIQIRLRSVAAGGPAGDMAIDDIEVLGRPLYGDMDGDQAVDLNDLSAFAGDWLHDDCDWDLDGDCLITLFEFAEFAGNWLDE